MKNKFWMLKRDPENLSELMEKMAGDFPDWTYFGFVDKFTAGKPKLKEELLKQSYFVEVGQDNQGNKHYMLGTAGIQLVHARKSIESDESMKNLTFWLVICTLILAIVTGAMAVATFMIALKSN